MAIDRDNFFLVGNIGNFLIVIDVQTHLYIYVQRGVEFVTPSYPVFLVCCRLGRISIACP